MQAFTAGTEPMVVRRVFPAWSIEIPASFAETFVEEDQYWHAYEERRSVSLTSLLLMDGRRPVKADRILDELGILDGTPIDELPPGLDGRATTSTAPPGARASRILSGILAADGRVLLVTVTSDDLDWARRIWSSIRRLPVSPHHLSASFASMDRAARRRPRSPSRARRGARRRA